MCGEDNVEDRLQRAESFFSRLIVHNMETSRVASDHLTSSVILERTTNTFILRKVG